MFPESGYCAKCISCGRWDVLHVDAHERAEREVECHPLQRWALEDLLKRSIEAEAAKVARLKEGKW